MVGVGADGSALPRRVVNRTQPTATKGHLGTRSACFGALVRAALARQGATLLDLRDAQQGITRRRSTAEQHAAYQGTQPAGPGGRRTDLRRRLMPIAGIRALVARTGSMITTRVTKAKARRPANSRAVSDQSGSPKRVVRRRGCDAVLSPGPVRVPPSRALSRSSPESVTTC